MPSFCAVLNCNSQRHSENISFHKFPLKRKDLLEQWEAFIQKQRGAWRASRWSSLCSRHFREDDFRSLNERKTLKKTAVPSILILDGENTGKAKPSPCSTKQGDCLRDKEFKEIMAIREQLEDVGSTAKTNCRLCGVSCIPVVTFGTNYELYGMLQKCFPTLNIQQEDAYPKVLDDSCYKNLQQFSEFVDIVWAAQTELQRKYKPRAVEKPPLKIKQEPLAVRVKQEVAEVGYDQQQELPCGSGIGANDDYDVMADGNHEEGDDPGAVDQKYEFCDFPINDCDIMEIINLDDPFINIPDDDNTTIVNEETEEMQKPINDERVCHLPSAHELLQAHLLMDEHNYAYVDTDDFKEERQVYKTEKSDSDERLHTSISADSSSSCNKTIYEHHHYGSYIQDPHHIPEPISTPFENRNLKPIVTSVSAIQQPSKGNGIVVLNESIVKLSGSGGCQIHACMVCHLNFFSVENLKEHYTQTHGTPMVTVPASNIILERNSIESKCNMKKEIIENIEVSSAKDDVLLKTPERVEESTKSRLDENENDKYKMDTVENEIEFCSLKTKGPAKSRRRGDAVRKNKKSALKSRQQHYKVHKVTKTYPQTISLNIMASQYQQLKKLYQTLQKKCTNLEQNVEQLQLLPPTITSKTTKPLKQHQQQPKALHNKIEAKQLLPSSTTSTKATPSYTCPVCSKTFPNANSLRQHKITHTEERKHICSLCQRCFKRRNGLLQHMKGFHLQVKPFVCHVCNHSYALKCDMMRCKHSTLKSSRNVE